MWIFYFISFMAVGVLNLCAFLLPEAIGVDKIYFELSILVVVIVLYSFFTKMAFGYNSYNLVILDVCFLSIYILPSIGLVFRGDREFNIGFLSLFLFIPLLMGGLEGRRGNVHLDNIPKQPTPLYWTVLLVTIGYGFLVAGREIEYIGVGYLVFLGLSVLVLHGVCVFYSAKQSGRLVVFLHFLIISCGVVGYLIFFWSGFGRLYAVTLFLLPVLVMIHHGFIIYRRFWVVVMSPAILFLAMVHRHGALVVDVKTFGGDSSAHHLIVQSELYQDAYRYLSDFQGLFDQLLLLYLNWVPRFFWEEKPLGFGLTVVDMVYSREGVSSGFSISPGLYGAHLFFNPNYWCVSAFCELSLFYLSAVAIRKCSSGNESIMIMYLANVPSLLWGGGATFGSRVWWSVIPAIAVLHLFRSIDKVRGISQ